MKNLSLLLLFFAPALFAQQPVNVVNWGSTALGAPSNYGTSPGAVEVMGVNANVTNTVAISAASLPLPTGASTAAKQPALGTAGSASADVITIQGIASMTKLLVTPDSVALPANQSVNVSQVNGTTTLTGTGAVGAGAQRVAVGTDTATIAGSSPTSALAAAGVGATGSAVPANASYQGGNGSGNTTGYLNCDNTATYDASTNGATQLVALSSGKIVYVCGFQISQSTTTSVHVSLEYGTGTACATSPSKITPAYPLQAATSTGPIGMVVMTPGYTGLKTTASQELCLLTDAGVSVQALVWYTQF